MCVAGRNEQKRTRLDGVPPLSVKEQAPSAGDEVNLVSRVGLLRIVADGRVELNHERTVRKDRNGEIASRRRPFCQCVGQTHVDDSHGWYHGAGVDPLERPRWTCYPNLLKRSDCIINTQIRTQPAPQVMSCIACTFQDLLQRRPQTNNSQSGPAAYTANIMLSDQATLST